jgi:uncharacterized protein YpmB
MSNLKGLKKIEKKIGIYAAHDDDAILGVGGRIVQHLKNGDDVYIVIFANGRNSHKAVLGIENNPSVWEVKEKRKEEIKKVASSAAGGVFKQLFKYFYVLENLTNLFRYDILENRRR